MRYRMIGPERGGRVTAVTGVPAQPYTFYMGSTGGGVWKTTDAGHAWTNVSDGQIPVGSMGAIEVSLSDPNIVTQARVRRRSAAMCPLGGHVQIYRCWEELVVYWSAGCWANCYCARASCESGSGYVATTGNPFIANKERGVYRSSDGGKTWKNILFVSDTCGAADLEFQPGSPNVIFASMWHGQRKPWTIISGAREGGIYKSTDGGEKWTKLAGGLPSELLGAAMWRFQHPTLIVFMRSSRPSPALAFTVLKMQAQLGH